MRRVLMFGLLFTALVAGAEIYRSTDRRGNPVYSDSPSAGGVPITLPETNTTPAVEVEPQVHEAPAAVSEDIPNLSITSPNDGQILANGLATTSVAVSLSQPLPEGFKLQFRLDGTVLQTGTATQLDIARINRGQHRISVALLDPSGQVQGQDSVSIMVYWPN